MQNDTSQKINNELGELDPIQIAYDSSSYDVKKYLDGEQFAKTVSLVCSANKANSEVAREINFICLMIALKVIDYNRNTDKEVIAMLITAGTDTTVAEQIWKDIETYIIPNIPELGTNHVDDGVSALGDTTINRAVTIDPHIDSEHITHFGPESIEMRLKNIGAPRITLAQLSEGGSLLHAINIDKANNTSTKVINHESHLDPYRELLE